MAVLKKEIESVIASSNTSSLRSPIEIQGKRGDGSQFPVEVSVSVRELPTGRVITCNVRDITKRKQDEDSIRRLNETLELRVAHRTAELRESEEHLRSLVEHLPQRIFIKDRNSVYLSCNENYASDLGITPEQIVGKDDFAFHPPELAQAYRADDQTCITTNMVKDLEKMVQIAGQERWLHTIKVPFHDRQGQVIGVLGILEDITDRKRAEKALMASETRYRQLADVTFEGIIFHDQGVLLQANDQYFQMFGYEPDELLGTLVLEKTLTPESVETVRAQIAQQSTQSYEAMGRKKDGTTFPIEVRVRIMESDGEKFRAAAIRDISRLKNLENQLLQSQKMEALGTLAGGIAHDFNNLLQAISGYSELLMMSKKQGDPELDDLKSIYDSTKRGADLVKSLMMFSRRTKPELRPVDMNQEIVEVQKILSKTISKTIEMVLRLSGKLETALADPSQIGQILMNLGVNARDAMPDGGTLTFETTNVQLDYDNSCIPPEVKPGPYVLLTVSDSGCGMDKHTVEHIFDPFFTTKEVGKGTGLGLATVYGLVKEHEGHITCDSEPGHGTTFKIYLPAIQTEKTLEPPKDDIPIQGGSETILLVEDEEPLRIMGFRHVSQYGYEVITASDGKEAVEIYQTKGASISLIILDLLMPVMDGRKCLEEILRINPNAKVIIASGVTGEGSAANVVQVKGAKGFVQKPYDMRQLLTTIREILDRD